MTSSHQRQQELALERLAFKLTAHLSDAAHEVPHDISERLRVARSQAVAQRKPQALRQKAPVQTLVGAGADLGSDAEHLSWWDRIASVLPLLVLVLGLIAIYDYQEQHVTQDTAEIDLALLADELPPSAYSDPGFSRFLQLVRHHSANTP